MTLITLNNKSVVIESASYSGTIYEGDKLEALVERLKTHLINISDDIDLSNHTFTVYRDRVKSNGKIAKTHPVEYQEIVEKTKNFVYHSPKSPLSQNGSQSGINPQALREKLEPLAITRLHDEIEELKGQIESQKTDTKLILAKIDELQQKPVNAKDTQISKLQEQLSNLQGLLAEKTEQVSALTEDLRKADEQFAAQETHFCESYNALMDQATENHRLVDLLQNELTRADSTGYQSQVEALQRALTENKQNTQAQRALIESLEASLLEKNSEFANVMIELSTANSSLLRKQHELQDLQLESTKLKDQLERAQKENQSVQQELSEANTANPKAIEELQEQLVKSNENIKHSETLLAAKKIEMERLNTSLKATENRVKKLEDESKAKLEQTQKSTEALETLLATQKDTIDQLNTNLINKQYELEKVQSESEKAQDAKDKLSIEKEELTSQLERDKKENELLQQRLSETSTTDHKMIDELRKKLKKSNDGIQHQKNELAAKKTEIDELNTSLKTTEDRVKKLEEDLKSARTERDNLTTANNRLQAQLEQTQDRIKSLETELANKQVELRTINSNSSSLKQDLETLQSERQKVKDKETKLKIEKEDLKKTNNRLKAELEQSKTENEKIHKDLFLAKANAADPKVIQDLNEKLKKSDDTIELWKSALKAQEGTIAQLNTQLSTFKHEVEKLNAKAEVKTREHEQVLRNLRLREQELATLRAQSAEMKDEISSIIAALKAEIERLKVKPKDEEIIETVVEPVESPKKSSNSIAEKIQNINNKDSLYLSPAESVRLEANMLFLEHPITEITDNTVTLGNKTKISILGKNSSQKKFAEAIVSRNKKFKGKVAHLRGVTNIDGFVGGLLNKKGVSAKDLLVQNGGIVPKLMASEFLSRNNQKFKEYNESLNEIRQALIDLKNRTKIEVVS